MPNCKEDKEEDKFENETLTMEMTQLHGFLSESVNISKVIPKSEINNLNNIKEDIKESTSDDIYKKKLTLKVGYFIK